MRDPIAPRPSTEIALMTNAPDEAAGSGCRNRSKAPADLTDVVRQSGRIAGCCLDSDVFHRRDPQKAENKLQVSYAEVRIRKHAIAEIAACAIGADQRGTAHGEQALEALSVVGKSMVDADDLIDPGFKRRRYSEIVHRYGYQEFVGRFEFGDQRVRQRRRGPLIGGHVMTRDVEDGNRLLPDLRNRVRREIAASQPTDLNAITPGCLKPVAEIAGNRTTAAGTRVDTKQKRHERSPDWCRLSQR